METAQLDHFTIKVSDLITSTQFYTDVVGLKNGARPDFAFGGAWLYCGDHPLVHLIDECSRQALGLADDNSWPDRGMGAMDHVAFRASGLLEMRQRLIDMQISFEEQTIPGQGSHQLFFDDPDGIRLEFNFPATENVI